MRTLLIDNYDSYTYIIAQYLWEVNGEYPLIIKNDALTIQSLRALTFDNIVLSPGPGTPSHKPDVGLSLDVLEEYPDTPTLGVCLGHQCLGHYFGGRIVRAPREQHGKYATLRLLDSPLFEAIPDGINVVRYHSLILDEASLPDCLRPIAWTADEEALIMAVQHRERPYYGVQFHPESIGTEFGKAMIRNFRKITEGWRMRYRLASGVQAGVFRTELRPWLAPQYVYETGFNAPYSFWLDSSRVGPNGRYSFMGQARRIVYTQNGSAWQLDGKPGAEPQPLDASFFAEIKQPLRPVQTADDAIPLPFKGGWVGYLAYDFARQLRFPVRVAQSPYPDGLFMWVDRFVAFDHFTHQMALCGLLSPEQSNEAFMSWCQQVADEWQRQTHFQTFRLTEQPLYQSSGDGESKVPVAHQDKGAYLEAIRRVQGYLKEGESYEVCLTNEFTVPAQLDPLEVYKVLRTTNPAPYSAYLRLPETAFQCSSPECFITVDAEGTIQSEPIKGTRAKGGTPEENSRIREELLNSAKDRSELLMITDLIRNDLSMCCQMGSVQTPEPARVTEYATVLQLSSLITGKLRPDVDALDVLRLIFPGGSITGAPKYRTVAIIDELEQRSRGLYTGSIGFLSADGQAGFNIAIRTMVHDLKAKKVSFGAGGAIVAESDPLDEYHEILTKAYALLRAIYLTRDQQFGAYQLIRETSPVGEVVTTNEQPRHSLVAPDELARLFGPANEALLSS